MSMVATLVRSRIALTLAAMAAVAVFSLAVVTPALGVTTDTFGITEFGTQTELGDADIRTTIARIINVALSLLGVVAVVIILAGGFKWMTAGGNEDKVAEARKLIFAGIIGLAIILSAYAIARFVLGQLSVATESGNVQGFN